VTTVFGPVDRAAVIERYRRHLGRGQASLLEMIGAPVEVEASGANVRTADGRSFIDCGGYAVFLLGHCHPRIVEPVIEQLRRHPLGTHVLAEPRVSEAAARLAEIAPAGLECVRFVNAGAEATELALKLARAAGRDALIAMHGGFHGKTLGALSVTGNERYRARFRPLLDAVFVDFAETAALEAALAARAGRACVIVEPIQGEGGVILAPPGYLAEVERLCRRHGALLVIDEIQTGLGRCGRWWASAPEVIQPDIVLVGKALSGGVVPVAAVIAEAGVFAAIGDDPALHSSTFAGSPLASAAVIATLDVLVEERIPERSRELGQRLLADLRAALAAQRRSPVVDVRGAGLLIGIQFTEPSLAAEVVLELLDRDVLVNHSLNNHAVLRLTPPAVISEGQLRQVVTAVADAVAAVRGPVGHDTGGGE